MQLEIQKLWQVDGELCVKGEFKGRAFQLVHCDTDVDYGWHCINYLKEHADYDGFEEDDDLEEWQELIDSMDVLELKKQYYGGLVDGRN